MDAPGTHAVAAGKSRTYTAEAGVNALHASFSPSQNDTSLDLPRRRTV